MAAVDENEKINMECTGNAPNLDQATLPLSTGTDLFRSRRHDVFSGLGELEKKHSAFLKVLSKKGTMEDQGLVKMDPDEENTEERDKPLAQPAAPSSHHRARPNLGDTIDVDYGRSPRLSTRQHAHRSQVSAFKRPQHRPHHRRGQGNRQDVPDFRKHPEKYTHYSLDDISEKEMSERSNSQAAFAFLEERRLQREREENAMTGLSADGEGILFDAELAACSQGQIAFSRPVAYHKDGGQSDKGDRAQPSSATKTLISNFEDSDLLEEERSKTDSSDIESLSDSGNKKIVDQRSPPISFKSRKTNCGKRSHIRKKANDDDDSD